MTYIYRRIAARLPDKLISAVLAEVCERYQLNPVKTVLATAAKVADNSWGGRVTMRQEAASVVGVAGDWLRDKVIDGLIWVGAALEDVAVYLDDEEAGRAIPEPQATRDDVLAMSSKPLVLFIEETDRWIRENYHSPRIKCPPYLEAP